MKNLKISLKVPLLITGAALLSCVVLGISSAMISRTSLIHSIETTLHSIVEEKGIELDHYLHSIKEDLNTVSTNQMTVESVYNFKNAWAELGDNPTEYLQTQYITNNPYPTGEKEKLDYADDGTLYSKIHEKEHIWFRKFLKLKGYYDIFIFDLEGNLLYTVFKELDYATNLNTGEYRGSDLGNAFRAAAASSAGSGDDFFFDFKPYAPSHGAAASFISTPIFDGREKIGVLVFQMPVDRLNALMKPSQSLGKTGETYIVGMDGMMRSQSRFVEENTILTQEVTTEAFTVGKEGQIADLHIQNYQDHKVFSSVRPLEFLGVKWLIIGEIHDEEAMAPVDSMIQTVAMTAIGITVLITLIGLYISRSISKPLASSADIITQLAEGNLEVNIVNDDRKDEVGDLARSARIFKENAIAKIQLQEEQKAAEEKTRIEREESEARANEEKRQAMMELAGNFEQRVQGIVSTVASAATELNQNAEEMRQEFVKSNEVAEEAETNAQSTSSNVQSVAAAAEEMSASVRELATQVQSSNEMVSDSVARAEKADAHAKALTEAADKVASVVDLISGISEKINLLALNAAVESAKAGESGKGFAVVASEIKSLATQTDNSIQDILSVIDEMRSASSDIISALSGIKDSVGTISESSSTMSIAIDQQSATTNEIASNMQTAANGTSAIAESVQQVSESSKKATDSSEQVLSASQELSKQSEELDTQVRSFLNEIRTS